MNLKLNVCALDDPGTNVRPTSLRASTMLKHVYSSSRKCCDCSCLLVINGATVREVNSTKYLGVIIDSSLTWSDHVDYIFNKLLKFVGIFYKFSFKLSPEILKQLYFAFIYPYISYGIEIYANA